MYLNESPEFKKFKAFPTKKEAEARLDQAFRALEPSAKQVIFHFVISRGPAQFVPVAVLGPDSAMTLEHFLELGIFVTQPG